MSGPVSALDTPPTPRPADAAPPAASGPVVEITPAREARVGNLPVRRALPRRARRTVGAWCFADHMGPVIVASGEDVSIAPHPHTGLHTVTWLLAGELVHRDSLGSEQVIRPGQVNLMTAGRGVAHSEESAGAGRGELHGVQLWVAQPEGTRHGPAAFEHHGELPRVDVGPAAATVLIGEFAGAASPARRDTPLVGVDVTVRPEAGGAAWPLDPSFEYALLTTSGALHVAGPGEAVVTPGHLAYLGAGRTSLEVAAVDGPARVLLLGGAPFGEQIAMWWNFVARARDELTEAGRAWNAGGERFGRVASDLPRIPAPPPPWSRSPGA